MVLSLDNTRLVGSFRGLQLPTGLRLVVVVTLCVFASPFAVLLSHHEDDEDEDGTHNTQYTKVR